MVKLQASFTLSLLIALFSIGAAQAEITGPRNGPRRNDKLPAAEKRTVAARATDPWANFKQFDWSTWATNWGWAGHTLAYVKAWYYDEYGLNLPPGVYSWPQLSYYVSYFGTYNPTPKPSISSYGGSNTEDPWVYGTLAASSSSSSSRAASTSTSTSTSTSSSAAKSSSSSAAAASSSSIASSTSSSKASSTSSSAAASSSAASLTGGVVTSNGWTSQGCYQDAYPHLVPDYFERNTSMTQEYCGSVCFNQGKPWMAVEYGSDCYCASSLATTGSFPKLADSQCNYPCAGNTGQNCGGNYILVLFKYTGTASFPSSSSSKASSSAAASSTSSVAASSSSSSVAASSSSSKAASSSSSSSVAASSSSSSAAASSSSSSVVASSSSSSAAASSSSSSAAASSSVAASSTSQAASSSTSSSASASATPTVPAGWKVADTPCIADGKTGRALLGSFTIDYANTIESCLARCDAGGYPIAGIEYGNQCFCGSYLSNGASLSTPATCAVACPGNNAQTCGGYYAMSLYVSTKLNGAALSSDLSAVAATLPSGWSSVSKCMAEVNGRALTDFSWSTDAMTVPLCLNKCASLGYQYGGVEYGRECYCGNSLDNGADLLKTSALCGTPCAGNPSTPCGGWNALQVFNNPAYSYSNTIVNGYVKTACLQEVANRALRGAAYKDESGMTVETCTQYCADRGFNMAGLEYGSECYCGSALVGGASLLLTSGECKMTCAGDSTENCGGPNAMWLYINPNTLTASVTLPTGWSYKGCIGEGYTSRALNFTATDLITKGTMTGEKCARQCQESGYNMAGTEYASQCYCGNSFQGGATGNIIDTLTDGTSQCNYPCPGNAAQMCGGGYRLSLYSKLATLPTISTGTGSTVVL
uniref:WSC domain-containing protein n=1 Tax=Kwoniella bestiolae CBS 10118 TaxID=1296100 RepID=A0A1B9G793_9TREE|nr:hypothetical protein I302_04595 [Kwoniella bestiolae CBS 10118]OCF26904.1 hypothetical protein I302_04595 [Kwoniella bestiolae CBS 10118]